MGLEPGQAQEQQQQAAAAQQGQAAQQQQGQRGKKPKSAAATAAKQARAQAKRERREAMVASVVTPERTYVPPERARAARGAQPGAARRPANRSARRFAVPTDAEVFVLD